MSVEDQPTGIPTRALHQAYVNMQRALREYRQAKDHGAAGEAERAHGEFQDAVLTFYEMLRPHIRENDVVADYWDGEPPSYKNNGGPDPDDGTAVLHTQQRTQTLSLSQIDADPDDLETLKDWDEELDMNGQVRLQGISGLGEDIWISYHVYQLGLRELDGWETQYVTTNSDAGGFMAGHKTETVQRERVDMPRLKRAMRELSDVAQKLGALSEFDAGEINTTITDDQVKEIEQWRRQNLD